MGQWLVLLTPECSTRGFVPETESGKLHLRVKLVTSETYKS